MASSVMLSSSTAPSFTCNYMSFSRATSSQQRITQYSVARIREFSGLKPQAPARLRQPCSSNKVAAAAADTKPLLKVLCQSTTLERVQEIIASQLSVDLASVQPDTKFSDLGADSLDTVEIVMAIEEKFGVSISEENAEKISNVQQVADLIEMQEVAS